MAATTLFEDIYVQASTFYMCEFSFYIREANGVADCLASETIVWVNEPPAFITALLIDDATIIWLIKLAPESWCFPQKKVC
jgi:hypothetical protein